MAKGLMSYSDFNDLAVGMTANFNATRKESAHSRIPDTGAALHDEIVCLALEFKQGVSKWMFGFY